MAIQLPPRHILGGFVRWGIDREASTMNSDSDKLTNFNHSHSSEREVSMFKFPLLDTRGSWPDNLMISPCWINPLLPKTVMVHSSYPIYFSYLTKLVHWSQLSKVDKTNREILSMEEEYCKICYVGDEEASHPLMSPCLCTGSLKYVHHDCLVRWIKISGLECCDLCKHPFTMESKLKPFKEWNLRKSDMIFLLPFIHIGIVFGLGGLLFHIISSQFWCSKGDCVILVLCILFFIPPLILIPLAWIDLTIEDFLLKTVYKRWKARNMCLTVFEIQHRQRNRSSASERTRRRKRFLA